MKRLIAATLVLCAGLAHADDEGRRWAAALKDPKLVDEAACRLILRNEKARDDEEETKSVPDNGCNVSRVVDNTARPDGAIAVFLHRPHSGEKLKDGSQGGRFLMFDREGSLVPSYEDSGSLRDPDGVITYRSDGDVAFIEHELFGIKGWEFEELAVVPVNRAQSPVLVVLMGAREGKGNKFVRPGWAWRTRDVDKDGNLEFEMGPEVDGRFEARATWRYSSESRRYEGPAGGPNGEFIVRAVDQDRWQLMADFARAHGSCADCANAGHEDWRAEQKQREQVFQQFLAARNSRDYTSADALAGQLASNVLGSTTDALASYWVFERSQCRVDFVTGSSREYYVKYNDLLSGGLIVCEAANLPEDETGQARAKMSGLLDELADGRLHKASLYDAYARPATINRRALQLLEAFHLDDRRFDRDGESAFIEQIRAGRVDNVRLLLEHGYDPNLGLSRDWRTEDDYGPNAKKPFLPLPILPLQAAVESLATRGEQALEIASLLIEHGANPNRLKWYPHYGPASKVDPELAARMDRVLADGAAGKEEINAEFRGLLIEYAFDIESQEVYARVLIGNGSKERVSIRAWTDGGQYLLNGLNSSSHLESRMEGGTKWMSPVTIEDGWSPSTKIDIEPGQYREVLMSISPWELAQEPEGMRRRIWINNYPGEIHSEPFALNGRGYPLETRSLPKARDWMKIKREEGGK